MLKPIAFSNAATLVTAIFYIICVLVSFAAPDLLISIFQSWVHTINLETVKSTNPASIGLVISGLITISVITWITTYALIWLYNRWAK